MLLFLKGHVTGYTKRDGTVVKPHETKVQGKLFAPQFGIGKLHSPSAFPQSSLFGPGSKYLVTPAVPKAYHPKAGGTGKPVGHYSPSSPTAKDTWGIPDLAVPVIRPRSADTKQSRIPPKRLKLW